MLGYSTRDDKGNMIIYRTDVTPNMFAESYCQDNDANSMRDGGKENTLDGTEGKMGRKKMRKMCRIDT